MSSERCRKLFRVAQMHADNKTSLNPMAIRKPQQIRFRDFCDMDERKIENIIIEWQTHTTTNTRGKNLFSL